MIGRLCGLLVLAATSGVLRRFAALSDPMFRGFEAVSSSRPAGSFFSAMPRSSKPPPIVLLRWNDASARGRGPTAIFFSSDVEWVNRTPIVFLTQSRSSPAGGGDVLEL